MNDLLVATVVAASLAAAVTDLWCYRIYNRLTFPLLVSGMAYWLLVAGGWGLAESVVGAGVGFGALCGLYLAGAMGAGDVKLMAGLGAWLGPAMISQVVLASCVAAGAYALVLLACRASRPGWCRRLRMNVVGVDVAQLAASPARRRQLIPFGLAIFIGLLVSLARAHESL